MTSQEPSVEHILSERRAKHVDSGRRQIYQVLSLVNQYSECESALVDAIERIEVMGDRSDQSSEQLRTRLEEVVLENHRQQKRVVSRLESVLPQVEVVFLASRVDNLVRFFEVLPRELANMAPGYSEYAAQVAILENGRGSITNDVEQVLTKEE